MALTCRCPAVELQQIICCGKGRPWSGLHPSWLTVHVYIFLYCSARGPSVMTTCSAYWAVHSFAGSFAGCAHSGAKGTLGVLCRRRSPQQELVVVLYCQQALLAAGVRYTVDYSPEACLQPVSGAVYT
jgi:hypothetical protein